MAAIELTTAALIALGTAAVGAGSAIGAARAKMGAQDVRISTVEVETEELGKSLNQLHVELFDRLARIETKIDERNTEPR